MKKLINILQNLIYTTYLAELLPFLTSLFFLKKFKHREVKVFFFYVFTIAFFICIAVYFDFIQKNYANRLLGNRIFLITEFALLSTYYYYQLQYKYRKPIFQLSTVAFFIYSVVEYLTAKSAQDFNFIILVVECLFFLLVIIYFFYEKIKFNLRTPIIQTPDFWVSVAFLLYFSGTFFLFLYSKSNFKNPSFKTEYTIIYGTITIIKDLLLTVSIFVNVYITNQKNHLDDPIDIDLGTFNPLQNKPNL